MTLGFEFDIFMKCDVAVWGTSLGLVLSLVVEFPIFLGLCLVFGPTAV